MKMNQKGRGNDEFCTPDYIYYQLERIFNFNMDVACNQWNCKTRNKTHLHKDYDGLKSSWALYRCFCNPPFSQKEKWIRKADYEVQNNNCPICVMILPLNSMDTKVWHEVIECRYHYEILKGRIAFIDPETKKPKKGNNSGTVIVYFKKRIEI